ncbi:DUF4245 domain-containing protein [Ammonicoccus fulvus]|uniref:DUF4245 domain-containing protein n=1 Tax=Ammonicoccus fulvus TaxID=3138240 RepID=A0ABZ3FUY4_9ACTN
MADKQRRASALDMVRSMAIIIIPVALIMWLLTNNLDDYPVEEVDWRPVLAEARSTVDWPVEAPEGLPEEGGYAWTASRASFLKVGDIMTGGGGSPRNHWRVGFLSPDKERVYFEVNQGDDQLETFVREITREGRQVGEQDVAGRVWETWESLDGRTRSLVLRADPTVTLVTADTGFPQLGEFAQTLKAS